MTNTATADATLLDLDTIAQIEALEGDFVFETYMSLTCQNCPDVVQALNLMSVLNPRIRHTSIDGALFQSEVDAREVMAVPTVFVNGEVFGQGRMSLEQIVAKLDTNSAEKAAAKMAAKDPFDVLIVGGGPAGAAAAIYTARKGVRTGVLADHLTRAPDGWIIRGKERSSNSCVEVRARRVVLAAGSVTLIAAVGGAMGAVRKAVTLAFARAAALRLHGLYDPLADSL